MDNTKDQLEILQRDYDGLLDRHTRLRQHMLAKLFAAIITVLVVYYCIRVVAYVNEIEKYITSTTHGEKR